MAEYYINTFGIKNNWKNDPLLEKIQLPSNYNRAKYSIQQNSILQTLYKILINKENLTITQNDKKVSILTIEVNSDDEKFSKIFCENLASETSSYYIETKSKKARINVDVLQMQADSVKRELNYAIQGVASESDNVYNLNPALNIKGAPSKKKQIDVQANTAVLTQILIQLELAKINLRKETPLIQIIDIPLFPLERSKIGKLQCIIIGFFIGCFLAITYLFITEYYKKIMNN